MFRKLISFDVAKKILNQAFHAETVGIERISIKKAHIWLLKEGGSVKS